MARPRKPEAEKRKQIPVRMDPSDRERLERLAEQEGASPGLLLERLALDQMAYLERTDPETRALIDEILHHLAAIRRATKGRWHKVLSAWAAASEMLSHVLEDRRPENPEADEYVALASAEVQAKGIARNRLVEELQAYGIPARYDPNSGLLGAQRFGLFGTAGRNNRFAEEQAIDLMDDGPSKLRASIAFAKLLDADASVKFAWERWADAMQPFWFDEEEGRKIGRAIANGGDLPATNTTLMQPVARLTLGS
jgi:hypothetical protein